MINMANTSYLRKVVEPFLLKWTAEKIGVPLESARVIVGRDSNDRPIRFAFDGVSEDGSVGVCISASSSYKTGQMRKYFMEATLLCRCPRFRRRIMVFTSSACWEGFKNQCDGLVDLCKIEAMICDDLSDEMRQKINEVYLESAKEVGDKAGPGLKIPGRRQ
ncbi:MAG: hypothetical protein MUP47_03370 [Phycisphaerae bacterium]|nr:hypothetical protein [Phycisphaerae bacterium]